MQDWIHWEPIVGLSEKYSIYSIAWLEKGVIITLSDRASLKKIKITFQNFVDAYRYSNKAFCSNFFSILSMKYGEEFYKNWTFFKVNNSEYIKWIVQKSYEATFIHFCILGDDEVVDILARYEPIVKIID